MQTLQEEHQTSDAPSIAAMPPPDPLAVLQEELETVRSERETFELENTRLKQDLEQGRQALSEARVKLNELESNPLTFALANLDSGEVLVDAGEQLRRLSTLVQDRQEKGTLTLKLTVKPFKGEALVFEPDVKMTEPKQDPIKGVFYADGDGTLSRNDPRQKEFSFRGRDRDEERGAR